MKKTLCWLMMLALLLTPAAPVFADPADGTVRQMQALVESIAAGEDVLAGGGVPFEFDTEAGEVSPLWESGGVNHTHQYILAQALIILRNDKGDKAANLLTKYASTLLQNSDWPDTSENDFGLYIGHFYDPYTGKTLLGMTSPTALTRFVTHAENAKKYYAKNKPAAMQELGRAVHYLSDINVPHHAALLTALDSNHTEFEAWADATRTAYGVGQTTLYSGLTVADPKRNYAGYCREIIQISARHGLEYVDEATSAYLSDWQIAAEASMEFSQEITAAFLYNFLRSVNAVK